MSLSLLVISVWFGLVLVGLAAMAVVGRHAARADSERDRLAVEHGTGVAMAGAALGSDVSVSLGQAPVLRACRDCLSVVSGAYETCPACGGQLHATHSLDTPADAPAQPAPAAGRSQL